MRVVKVSYRIEVVCWEPFARIFMGILLQLYVVDSDLRNFEIGGMRTRSACFYALEGRARSSGIPCNP